MKILAFAMGLVAVKFATAFCESSRAKAPLPRRLAFCNLCNFHRVLSTSRREIHSVHLAGYLTDSMATIETAFYEHDGWKIAYRHKAATLSSESSCEKDDPILLIHPIGVGQASWFWENFMNEWEGSGPVYAPNLIGCGIADGSDKWDPEVEGEPSLSDWVQGCETFMKEVVLKSAEVRLRALAAPGPTKKRWKLFRRRDGPLPELPLSPAKCTIIVQGGVAPVGVQVARRNPELVSRLIMTSPPTWKDMTTPMSPDRIRLNYQLYRSDISGPLLFGMVEKRGLIKFFSEKFLFKDKCDHKWLDRIEEETCEEARPPIEAFNAGFLMENSLENELLTLEQHTLILQGEKDEERNKKRLEYAMSMKHCTIETIDGLNVLPWENPQGVCEALNRFATPFCLT